MCQTNDFFEQHGDKPLVEIPLTLNDLFAVIKERLMKEAKAEFEASWRNLP